MAERQISAFVSEETRRLLDEYSREHGLKKGFLVEAAVLHHLQALRELPADVVIPPRLVVSDQSLREVADLLERPPKQSPALKRLMRAGPGEDG